jgi:hypothetical protein
MAEYQPTRPMRDRTDLSGRVFNRLLVIRKAIKTDPSADTKYVCECSCGRITIVLRGSLVRGDTSSCGCRLEEVRSRGANLRHGLAGSVEYGVWSNMISRCFNRGVISFPNYGGRGITVCERWRLSFEAFYEDIGPRPGPEYSIERRDVNGNYEPGNCRWATKAEQSRNKRNNFFIIHDGRKQTLADWSRETGICEATIRYRIRYFGWSPARALTTPGRNKPV